VIAWVLQLDDWMFRSLGSLQIVNYREADGRSDDARLQARVEEIQEYIHGWAAARALLK
jgi:hypothetical protein